MALTSYIFIYFFQILKHARLAKSLTKPSIDLDAKNSVNQTHPSFPSIDAFDESTFNSPFEENEVPNFEEMLKRLPERAHLLPEDPPALPVFEQDDGFGEESQIVGPSIFDDDFDQNNPITGGVSEATRVDLHPTSGQDAATHAQMETFIDENLEGIDDPPNAPIRASGAPENGVRSRPPPKFSESIMEEPQPEDATSERPPDIEPMDDIPEVIAPPPMDNVPEDVVIPATNDDVDMEVNVTNAPPTPNNESGSTGIELMPTNELTENGGQPPLKRRRRNRRSKLRVDRTTQLDKDNMRQGWTTSNDDGERQIDLTDLKYKPAKKLLNENFDLKNKNSKLNAMLRSAATEEKFTDGDDEANEEQWETIEEHEPEAMPQDLPEVSLAPSAASEIRGSDIRGKRLSTLINSADASRQSLEAQNTNVVEIENVPENDTDVEFENPLEAIQENVNEEEASIQPSVESSIIEDQFLPSSQNEARPLFVAKLNENSSNETMDWSEINQRAGITTRHEAVCMFNALLHGIAQKKFRAEQDGFFAPIEVKKL